MPIALNTFGVLFFGGTFFVHPATAGCYSNSILSGLS